MKSLFNRSHPVRSEPRGPSLWLSCRRRRWLWTARTASSSRRCTGGRRSSATTPPSWRAVWAGGAAATPAGKHRQSERRWVYCTARVQEALKKHETGWLWWTRRRALLFLKRGSAHFTHRLTQISLANGVIAIFYKFEYTVLLILCGITALVDKTGNIFFHFSCLELFITSRYCAFL